MMKPRDAGTARILAPLQACAEGRISPNVALMQMIIAAGGEADIGTALAQATAGEGDRAGRVCELAALWHSNPQAFRVVKAVMSEVDHGGAADDPAQGVAHWTRLFDRMAQVSPEAGVALYALGNPDLLQAATDEAVALLRGWGLLGADRMVLDLGCGIGRFTAALSPHVRHVTGLDVSPEMIARARDRCEGLPNVSLDVANGHDFRTIAGESMDLILAADVFPYLVLAGSPVVERHLDDAARTLKPGGALVVLNYSYGGDPERDRMELEALGASRSLDLEDAQSSGVLSLWDAAVFRLRKSPAAIGAGVTRG
jgi:predicted TPR repeat methyltransferase